MYIQYSHFRNESCRRTKKIKILAKKVTLNTLTHLSDKIKPSLSIIGTLWYGFFLRNSGS